MNSDFDWRLIRSFLAALDRGSLLGAARRWAPPSRPSGATSPSWKASSAWCCSSAPAAACCPPRWRCDWPIRRGPWKAAPTNWRAASPARSAGRAGTVRITASQPVACFVLPPVLAQMRLALPEIQVELVASNEVSNLLRREADIALRMVQPDQASLVAKRIGKVTLGAYAHRDYLRRRGTPRQPAGPAGTMNWSAATATKPCCAALRLRLSGDARSLRASHRRPDRVLGGGARRAWASASWPTTWRAWTASWCALLPMLKIPPLPIWLTVHREIRTSPRIRAVYDFLATAVPRAL